VADVLRTVASDDRLVGRLGGDEFVVLLPRTSEDEARALAERINVALRGRAVGDSAITVSVGVATDATEETLSALVRRADMEMLQVKGQRRQPGAQGIGIPLVTPAAIASVG
jgi:diguanylate cyclase (GGDEF)-like protein